MRLITAFLCLLGLASARLSYGGVYYDFNNGCADLSPSAGPKPFLGKLITMNGEVYAMSVLTHQVLKIEEDQAGNPSCSVYGYLPVSLGSSHPGISGGTFSLSMDADPSGNIYISNTGAGPFSTDYGSIWKLSGDALQRPIRGERLYASTAQYGLPSGVVVMWRHNSLLYTSETDGVIYRLRLLDNSVSVWLDIALLKGTGRVPGQSPDASINNTNLLGGPIGATGIAISTDGRHAFVGVGDTGLVLRVDIDQTTGDAGDVEISGKSPEHTTEGVVISASGLAVYWTSVFANGTNLSPNSAQDGSYQGGVLPGNAVWEANLQTGTSIRFYDARMGAVTGLASARGVRPGGARQLFGANSALSALPAWPTGAIRNDVIRADYSTAGTPAAVGPAFVGATNDAHIFYLNID